MTTPQKILVTATLTVALGTPLGEALRRYLAANDNQPPTDGTQLAAYFDPPVDPAILQRYGPLTAEQSRGLPVEIGSKTRWLMHEKAPVDEYYDGAIFLGKNGAGYRNVSLFGDEVQAAIEAFQVANPGQKPTAPTQLAPYLHSMIDPTFVQQKLGRKE